MRLSLFSIRFPNQFEFAFFWTPTHCVIMIAIITTVLLSVLSTSAPTARNFITDGTIVGDCGESCSSIVEGNVNLTSLVACIATISERPTCNITYAAPGVAEVTETCSTDSVLVTVTADSAWVLGLGRGAILAANGAVTETESCPVKVYEGSDCGSTGQIGTLDLKKDSTTRIIMSLPQAVIKAETTQCAARLTEEYLDGRIIVGVLGGGSDGASELMSVGIISLVAFYLVTWSH
eukprot:Blabericola_migrator_1__7473@NODE_3814_length_1490_cov_46_839072_g2366_i0_p1_GENE_NODE_3814_length_1490_cov_46_839072_g2366_i0NODE_3814_length_1490_cov_46_839072_g2366_i0_p1_ORF_typecomplete_len235_score40_06_NODE_3814_length_1490_cov_46_839072_g2366_i03571061